MVKAVSNNIEQICYLVYNAFQHSTDAIVITDTDGVIIEVNKAFTDVFGWTREEAIGSRTNLLRSSRTSDADYEEMWRSINTKGEWKGEIYNKRKDGTEIPILLSITPILKDGERIGFMGIEIDITERKKVEKRLLRAERFATIGKMAAKVAHEIRNPLSSISLNVELLGDEILEMSKKDSGEARNLLHAILAEIDKLTNLTEEYLQFSRLSKTDPQPEKVMRLIEEIVRIIEPEANSTGIQVVTRVQKNIPEILCDRQQIQRLLLNIIKNATEAMPHGGILHIRAKQNDRFIEIAISDTGEGVRASALNRIFEPFFTTKDMGTGLGLAISRQIVEEHDGEITCKSKVESGTTFRIKLPISREHQKTQGGHF